MDDSGARVGSCRYCGSWGRPRGDGVCQPCRLWQVKRGRLATCRRCGCRTRLNREDLCRICLVDIRYHDHEWLQADIAGQIPPRRQPQLAMLLAGVPAGDAHPLHRNGRRRPRLRPPSWAPPPPRRIHDDPRVCTPTTPGQLVLLRVPRRFTDAYASRIRDRPLPEMDLLRPIVEQMRAHGLRSEAWSRRMLDGARLALAARDPAEDLVREEDLDALPSPRAPLTEALRRAGMLRPRSASGPPPRSVWGVPQRNCDTCLAWDGSGKRTCAACKEWRRGKPSGRCRRCYHLGPIKDQLCRFCSLALSELAGERPVDQLWFGGQLALNLRDRRPGGRYGTVARGRTRVLLAAAARDQVLRLRYSAQHRDPDQLVLVSGLPRDWTHIDLARLPALTAAAQQLVDEFAAIGHAERWTRHTAWSNLRSLHIVLAWLGADTPIPETDVTTLTAISKHPVRRVVQFLDTIGLLERDPTRDVDVHQAATERMLATVPQSMRRDITAWIEALRGRGRKPSPAMSWPNIRNHLRAALPTLRNWEAEGRDLRSITSADVRTVIARQREPHHGLLGALRSLFRALKRERLVFHDPVRHLHLAFAPKQPVPVPTDRLQGLLARARHPQDQLAIALVAVHALTGTELRRLRLPDLDRTTGRLTSHRHHGTRIVILDELTLELAADWIQERTARWPLCTNPHLLLSQQSATDPHHPPTSRSTIEAMFTPLGIGMQALRIDRILDEARHTADPVHLMRQFNITAGNAIKYVRAAHPERFTIDPIAP